MGQDDTMWMILAKSKGILSEQSMDDYLNRDSNNIISSKDIELEVDGQRITIGDIKKSIQKNNERLSQKKSGNTLLINGSENIEK